MSHPFLVDYWRLTAALGKALHELEADRGADVADSALNLLTIELEAEFPDLNLDWANAITDSAGWSS